MHLSKPRHLDHGRHIYAYAHIRTNQIVYSLTRTLRPSPALRQLPDLGANHKDARIRKDLWKPLFTLTLPQASQGLHCYHQLREYRHLHEVHWQPSPLLARPYSEEEVEEVQKELDERGGSKKETVWDIITRRKKKLRVKAVQDQKANSVADLAAVLLEQEEMGIQVKRVKGEEEERRRLDEVAFMLALAGEAERDGVKRIEGEVERLEEVLAGAVEGEEVLSRKRVRSEMHALKVKKVKMQFAAQAVQEARAQGLEGLEEDKTEADHSDEAAAATAEGAPETQQPETQHTESSTEHPRPNRRLRHPRSSSADGEKQTTRMQRAALKAAIPLPDTLQPPNQDTTSLQPPTPSIPDSKLHTWALTLPAFPTPSPTTTPLPKRGPLRARLRRLARPIFSTHGVQISWANVLDAEYAAEWPVSVQHTRMGFARNTAPKVGEAAVEAAGAVAFGREKWERMNEEAGAEGQRAMRRKKKTGEGVRGVVRGKEGLFGGIMERVRLAEEVRRAEARGGRAQVVGMRE